MSKNVLKIENTTMQFGGVVAVDNLNLEINEGEIVALIGPNGAGKTTAFNVVTGVYRPTNGRVAFQGETIIRNHPQGKMKSLYKGENPLLYTSEYKLEDDREYVAAMNAETDAQKQAVMKNLYAEELKARKETEKARDPHAFSSHVLAPTPDKITKLGMARTFQNIRLWKSQTVFENVLIAKHCRATSNMFSAALRLNRKEEAAQRAHVEELLETVGLSDVKNELATSLPYGKQRRLEIARALAAEPKLLLLDEPAAGMNPQETDELTAFIGEIRDRFQLTIFLIEHHMNLVMGISDRIYVLDFGKLIAEGTPAEIQNNQRVIDAYLGVAEDA